MSAPQVRTVVGVTFDQWGRAGDFSIDPARVIATVGSLVIVESARGQRIGRVTTPPHAATGSSGGRIRRVVRVASASDLSRHDGAQRREPEAFRAALTLIRRRRLPVKLLKVLLDGVAGRATLFVAAPDAVDLGDLAAVLGTTLDLSVEVRAVGMRDLARAVGGVGRCGRELCCSTFLTEYPKTSVRMAKDQNLALNDDRTSGVCGKTLCCLAYEHAFYKDRRQWLPKLGKQARTADGRLEGKVIGVDMMALSFTLLDNRRTRHTVPARDWERNVGRELPEADDAPPAEAADEALSRPAPAAHETPRQRRPRPKKDPPT